MQIVRTLKIAAVASALIPIGFLLFFALGEGGDTGHFLQAAPLIVLTALAWYYPRTGGYALMAAAIIVGVLFAIASRTAPILVTGIIELILFCPMILSGIFFIRADERAIERQAIDQ